MLRAAAALALAAALAVPGAAGARRRAPGAALGAVVLEGDRVPVRWIDGDTFRLQAGRFAGRSARLGGVNALETYGPVHRIGRSGPRELLALAKETARLAASRTWQCRTEGRSDRYGRLLVHCDDAAEALVLAGHALVFAVDGPADERLLDAQRRARAARAGMWAGGTPALVPTSLHSADEPGLGPGGAYDRVADARTGIAAARPHGRRYAPCEEVCLGEGDGRACLVHVPFHRRFRDRPRCLR